MTRARQYRAFISYSHGDEAEARWLQRALEGYRTPASLRAQRPDLPRRLYPVFRDRDELASAHDLSESIRHALDDSDALVVVCSPQAAASRWVGEEVRHFIEQGRGHRVFCYLVGGSPDPDAADCAFPPALLREGPDGRRHEPLAADATPAGDGRRNALLKIAAGLLEVGVDELKRRDAQRQARFWASVATGALAVAVLTGGLAVYAFQSRQESELRRQQAEGLVGFMIGDLRDKLEPIGKLELLDSVGDEVSDYFATLGNRGTPREMLARAVALRQIGDVRFNQGKLAPALEAFEQSLAQARQLHEAEPGNDDYLFELGQAEFWVGYVAWERGELDQAEQAMRRYLDVSLALKDRTPGNPDFVTELAYAYSNLGSLSRVRGEAKTALAYFGLCLAINREQLAERPGDLELTLTLAETLSWIGSTTLDDGDLAGGERAFGEAVERLRTLQARDSHARVADVLARNLSFMALAQLAQGKTGAAREQLDASLAIYDTLTAQDPENAAWSHSAHLARLTRLGLQPPADWDEAGERMLARLLEGLAALNAQDPAHVRVLPELSHALRLQALRALATGRTDAALDSARRAHGLMADSLRDSDYSAPRLAELARAAEVLGTVQMARGDADGARATWREAAARLDAQDKPTFEFLPVRHLLAIDLGEDAERTALAARLRDAGFRDPRMDPEYTLSGAFRAATTPLARSTP